MKAISLFSGMGGDTLGMKNAGVKVVAYSEKVKVFRDTHEANFPKSKLLGKDVGSDILKITDEEFKEYKNKIDIIFAGFPCQSFSQGGKRKVNDPRNTMFNEFVRAARCIKPKIIIGENVKGLLTKKTEEGEKYIDIIVKEFEKLNYKVIYKVMACHKYGIPQKRERLIILGIKKSELDNFNLSFPDEFDADVSLKDIIEFSMEGTMKIDDDIFDVKEIPKSSVIKNTKNKEKEQDPHPYLVMKRDMENKSYGGKNFTSLFSFSKRGSPIHCEIVDITMPSKTIICTYNHQPRLFVTMRNKNGYYLRMMTCDELKQIQSFPKDFIVCGNKKEQITQIGNAVPPRLIELIVNHVKN
jgi:DNA (cytosine-5)-methyltransferase 1